MLTEKKTTAKLFATITTWLQQPTIKPKILIILGPTGSGKTALAIQCARKFQGAIINADSRQIYRGLKIGSARPTPTERRQAQHFLLARFSPQKELSVAEYRKLVETKIAELTAKKCLPILAGGHSLLLTALIENYQFPPKVDPVWQAQFNKHYQQKNGPQKLWQNLKKIDPLLATKIAPQNKVHLARTLERLTHNQKPQKGPRKFEVFLIGLDLARSELYARIEKRVDTMLEQGLLAEVQRLQKKYPRFCPALRGHGYRELLDYLAGEKTFAMAVAEIKRNTRHYAKRQMSWWRNSPLNSEIFWLR